MGFSQGCKGDLGQQRGTGEQWLRQLLPLALVEAANTLMFADRGCNPSSVRGTWLIDTTQMTEFCVADA